MSHPRSPATKEQLKKIVLQASDLPAGWQAGPYLGLPDEAGINAVMADCMGTRDTTPDMVAETKSAGYTNGKVQVESIAASYRSERDLDEDFGALSNPRLSPCQELLNRKILEGVGVTVGSLSIKATPAPAGSPANVVGVVTAAITETQGGSRIVEHDRVTFIRGPLIEVQVEMTSTGPPIPEDLMNSLVAKIAARAASR